MKKCSECNIEKDFVEFGKLTRSNDGLQYKCKECKRNYDNKFHKNRSKSQLLTKALNQKKRVKEIREFYIKHMDGKSCNKCEENRIATLDFHHIKDKKFNISDAVSSGYSIEKIKKEIEKCEILCSNCHRVETAKERNWYKNDF